MTHKDDCEFCDIVAGRAEARMVLRTMAFVAFFPTEPAVLGHVLVVPTGHYETIYDLDPTTAASLGTAIVEVARAVRDTFHPEGLNVIQSNGEAATQTVDHVHFHLVPRNHGDAIVDPWPKAGVSDQTALDTAQADLARALLLATPNEADREDRRQHLHLVSNVIGRLSQSSARAKGWTVTAAGAAFGVAAFDGRWYISLLGVGVILGFAYLDTKYLYEERRFVALYRAAAASRVPMFDMNKNAFNDEVDGFWRTFFSWSVAGFYLMFLVLGLSATTGGALHDDQPDRTRPPGKHAPHHSTPAGGSR